MISSRPGQSGRCDGYLLEGAEYEFYRRKMYVHLPPSPSFELPSFADLVLRASAPIFQSFRKGQARCSGLSGFLLYDVSFMHLSQILRFRRARKVESPCRGRKEGGTMSPVDHFAHPLDRESAKVAAIFSLDVVDY